MSAPRSLFGMRYANGEPLEVGDLVHLLGHDGDFQVRTWRPEGVAVVANVTAGFDALGTSSVSVRHLTLVRRADVTA